MNTEALEHVHEAASIPPQQRLYLQLELKSITEDIQSRAASPGWRARRQVGDSAAIKLLAPVSPAVRTVGQKLIDAAERQARLVRAALRLWDHTTPDELIWQMALVSLRQQLRNLQLVRTGVRDLKLPAEVKPALVRRILWPADLEKRYREVEEDLDDLMETLALGLSPAMRARINESLSHVSDGR